MHYCRVTWAVLAAFALAAAAWPASGGVAVAGYMQAAGAAICLGLIALVYTRVRPAPAVADLAAYGAGWFILTGSGGLLSYLAAAAGRPLQDASFAALDAAIGFDWIRWTALVRAHSVVETVLSAAYNSLLPQIVLSLLLLAHKPGRNAELLLGAAVSLALTLGVFALLPALGPWVHYGVPASTPSFMEYVPHLIALRAGEMQVISMPGIQGIICLPSYHTVLAILFVWAHRGLRSFPLVAAVNGVMILSIPSEGGHYGIDMLAGAVAAAIAIWAVTAAAAPQESAAPAMESVRP